METDVRSHRLVPEGGSSKDAWQLELDDKGLVLHDASGQPVFEIETALAHHVIDLSKTFIDGTICFAFPDGELRFKQNSAALEDLRELVEAGLRYDPEYRSAMRLRSLRAMAVGPVMFLVAGGLFGCYCWYASWAPDPPADSWIRWLGWLVKGVLTVLLAIALLGLGLGCSGFRQWWRIRKIERTIDET
jgi:hypothetical protein